MSDVVIRSRKIEMVAIEDVRPNNRNRNKHPEAQIERLIKIIKHQGFRQPLIVSNQSGLLVAGHWRLIAAKRLGMTEVPVVRQDFDSEDQEYQAQVSDNAIAEWAELDLAGINADLASMGPFDIELLGIDNFLVEVADKIDHTNALTDDLNKKYTLEVTFPNEMEMMDIHDDLASRGYIVKARVK